MEPYEQGSPAAKRGGSSYHVSFRSASRASGASARAAHDYITRAGEYDDPSRDPATHVESGNIRSGQRMTHGPTGMPQTCTSARTAACV
jgi:hypothetical protein